MARATADFAAAHVAPHTSADQGAAQLPPAASPLAQRANRDRTDVAQVTPQRPTASPAGSPADASIATPTGPGPQRVMPSLSDRREAVLAAPQTSPAVPTAGIIQWGMPVELPAAVDPVFGAPARPRGDETAVALSDRRAAVADPPPSRASVAVRELLPPPAQPSRAPEQPSLRPGGSSQDTGTAPRARLSIGTIEVTVVPPARPAPPASNVPPPALGALSRSRSGTMLDASPGSDPLRDGWRRWYGTAQG